MVAAQRLCFATESLQLRVDDVVRMIGVLIQRIRDAGEELIFGGNRHTETQILFQNEQHGRVPQQ